MLDKLSPLLDELKGNVTGAYTHSPRYYRWALLT